jgi:hypothetical protein
MNLLFATRKGYHQFLKMNFLLIFPNHGYGVDWGWLPKQ